MNIFDLDRKLTERHDLEEQLGDLVLAKGHLDNQIERLRNRLSVLPMGRRHVKQG